MGRLVQTTTLVWIEEIKVCTREVHLKRREGRDIQVWNEVKKLGVDFSVKEI